MLSAGGRYWLASAEPRPSAAYLRGEQRFIDALRQRRNHQCVSASGKCFASGQCCSGLVCASIDDYLDLKPDTPGFCVKEKDLQPCDDRSDCPSTSKCLPLGRSNELYCLPSAPSFGQRPASEPSRANSELVSNQLGKLGSACQSTADCSPYTEDETSRMCCQNVHRFRQPTRRQCDRYRENVSICIGSDR